MGFAHYPTWDSFGDAYSFAKKKDAKELDVRRWTLDASPES